MSQEKTELPTDKRRHKARSEGRVAKSTELRGGLTLLVFALTFPFLLSALVHVLQEIAYASFSLRARVPSETLTKSLERALLAEAPLLALLAAMALLFQVLQTGFVFSPKALIPKASNINPVNAAKEYFSKKKFVESLKSLFIIIAVSLTLFSLAKELLPSLGALPYSDPPEIASLFLRATTRVVLTVALTLTAIGLLDIFYQRWQLTQELKMSKDEVKREYQDAEGDPHIKQERQRAHREMAEHNILESVRDAKVLVVNPTHIAVALFYDDNQEEGAPEVCAKGNDELALRMIKAAREAGVPVVRNIPLARALSLHEIGEEIPEEFYDAVALILNTIAEEV